MRRGSTETVPNLGHQDRSREYPGAAGQVAAVGDRYFARRSPGQIHQPLLQDRALQPDRVHVLVGHHARGGQPVPAQRVVHGEVGVAEGGIGVQQALPPADDLVPRKARFIEVLRWRDQQFLQGVVVAFQSEPVEHVDECKAVEFRLPLQHDLLKDLDGEAVPDESPRDGIAKGLDAAQALKLGPERESVGVGHGESGLGNVGVRGLSEQASALDRVVMGIGAGRRNCGKRHEDQHRQYGRARRPAPEPASIRGCRGPPRRRHPEIISLALEGINFGASELHGIRYHVHGVVTGGVNVNGHDVDTIRARAVALLPQVRLGEPLQLAGLGVGEGGARSAKGLIAARLDFHEHGLIAVHGDNIELATADADVAVHDACICGV